MKNAPDDLLTADPVSWLELSMRFHEENGSLIYLDVMQQGNFHTQYKNDSFINNRSKVKKVYRNSKESAS